MRLPRPWRGTPADPSRQGRGRPPPLAGRVRPNSERVPHGFASLTGQTRPARGGGRVLRRIFAYVRANSGAIRSDGCKNPSAYYAKA